MPLNILQCTGQPPTAGGYPVQNVNRAEIEKLWFNPSAMGSYRGILD